jgi:hypothetical protein
MYPFRYEADYQRERNRATTFFRLLLAIPWLIMAYIYAIGAGVVWLIAWFAILFTGRYPQGMYNFVSGYLRFQTRLYGWMSLITDAWPSFGLGEEPGYPVRVIGSARAERQSRVKAFFRGILALPLFVFGYAVYLLHYGAAAAGWLAIVFRGYQPAGIHNALLFTNGWLLRTSAYLLLLTDEYPPMGDERNQVADLPAPAQSPLATSTATTETPTQTQGEQ